MILWITGARHTGKTTLARYLQSQMRRALVIDGDDIRESLNQDLGFENADRIENNMRIARLVKILEKQGFDIIVATICPNVDNLWERVYNICKCKFIHL
ncbi:MAG: adenylyl-sulfate kinase [Nanoarchaeota archaeon]